MTHRVDLDDDTLLLLDGHCDTKTQVLIDQIKEKRAFDERHAALRAAERHASRPVGWLLPAGADDEC